MTTHSNSTIAILGGAGKAGRPLVQEALARGYHVRLLLRHPEQFTIQHERLTVISGDARHVDRLSELLHGCEALISTLGSPGVPILSQVTQHLLTLLPAIGISRYITVTSLYDTGQKQAHPPTQQAADYMREHFPAFMADRQAEYDLLQTSALDWTYIRLPYLVEEPATGRVKTSLGHLPGQQITVADLARFLMDQLQDRQYGQKAPFLANG